MSTHHTKLQWGRTTDDFAYDTFAREHTLMFGGGRRLEASSAQEYKGRADLPNPEEMLVSALSSCHMLTFLAICARKGIVVDAYEDTAVGQLEKNAEGRIAVTRVTLSPKVTFAASANVDAATLAHLHESAHRGCFIAQSVKTDVQVTPA